MKNGCPEERITTLPSEKLPHPMSSIFRENRYVLPLLER
jgi:hypothetical protein